VIAEIEQRIAALYQAQPVGTKVRIKAKLT